MTISENSIDYLNAHKGGIQCSSSTGGLLGWSASVSGLAYIMETNQGTK